MVTATFAYKPGLGTGMIPLRHLPTGIFTSVQVPVALVELMEPMVWQDLAELQAQTELMAQQGLVVLPAVVVLQDPVAPVEPTEQMEPLDLAVHQALAVLQVLAVLMAQPALAELQGLVGPLVVVEPVDLQVPALLDSLAAHRVPVVHLARAERQVLALLGRASGRLRACTSSMIVYRMMATVT